MAQQLDNPSVQRV